MGTLGRCGLVVGVALSLVGAARPASAYVPYVTSAGKKFHWARSCLTIKVYADDLTDLTPAQTLHAATAAAAAWGSAANACAGFALVVEPASGPGPGAVYDHQSTITFHSKSWCHLDSSTGRCTPYDDLSPSVTSTYVSPSTGEIQDADVELNALSFLWTDADLAAPAPGALDLQNTLTYAIGHVLGFDASCWRSGAGNQAPLDDMGNPSPDCATASQAVRETTMFPSTVPGDTSKRTLAPDDQRALCETYPAPVSGDGGRSDAQLDASLACADPADGATTVDDAGDVGATLATDAAAPADAHDAAASPDAPDAAADAAGDGSTLAAAHGCGCAFGRRGPDVGVPVLAFFFIALARKRPRA